MIPFICSPKLTIAFRDICLHGKSKKKSQVMVAMKVQ